MKPLLFSPSLVILIAGLLITGFASTPPALAEVITLKALTSWDESYYNIQHCFTPWKERVNKELEGRLKIERVGGPEVVASLEQMKPVKQGLFDILFTNFAYHPSDVPAGQAWGLFPATEEQRRQVGFAQIADEMYQKKVNLKVLTIFDCGHNYQLFLNKKIEKADLTGLKIRGTPYYHPLIRGLNGAPVVTPMGEIYEAMARGVVDGFCAPLVGVLSMKWHEVAKYLVMPGFGYVSQEVFINLDRWNQLPKSLQDDLIRISRGMEKEILKKFIEKIVPAELEEMKKAGMQVIELPAAEGKKMTTLYYSRGWEELVLKFDPVYGPRLKAAADRLLK